MKKLNIKGFTLVELLAAMVILGIIMAIAVPNVIGILNNSRANTYVEDAKRFISLAEYKFRAGNGISKPSNGKTTVVALSYVDNSEFENAPNGNEYDKERSKVFIHNDNGTYKYYVVLVEDMGDSYRGINNVSYEDLYMKSASDLISNLASVDKVEALEINDTVVFGNGDKAISSSYETILSAAPGVSKGNVSSNNSYNGYSGNSGISK